MASLRRFRLHLFSAQPGSATGAGQKRLRLVTAGLLSMLAMSCGAAPKEASDPNGPRPPLDQSGFVRHTETITVQMPIQALDKWRRSRPLETILHGTKRIPGVDHTEVIRGTWGEAGARRRVILKDGNQTTEEILEDKRPSLFRYEVWGFTNWARFLTDYAVGEFQFQEVPGGTEVHWTYSFHQKSILVSPLVAWVVQNDFAEFMRSTLQTMKQEAERQYRKT
jgi:hypothetical protein